jgi:hypothetical protein
MKNTFLKSTLVLISVVMCNVAIAQSFCKCNQTSSTNSCLSVSDLYAKSKIFQKNLLTSFKAAGIKKPTWVPNGLQSQSYPEQLGNKDVFLGYLSEPKNAPHQLAVIYYCSTGRVAGAFILENKIIEKKFGKPNSDEINLIKSRYF